jgi:hypothetical protein
LLRTGKTAWLSWHCDMTEVKIKGTLLILFQLFIIFGVGLALLGILYLAMYVLFFAGIWLGMYLEVRERLILLKNTGVLLNSDVKISEEATTIIEAYEHVEKVCH